MDGLADRTARRVRGGRYRWAIEGVLLPVQVAMGLNFFAPAPLFPLIMEEYGLGRGAVSLLVAAVTVMLATFSLPAGFFAAKVGTKRAFAVGTLLMSAGALAPLMPNFFALLLLRVSFGIGAGIALPVTSAIVMQWFVPRELPVLNGLNISAQSLGVALSMFLSAPLAAAVGWPFPLFLYGAITFLGFAAWVLVGRRPEGGGGVVAAPPPVKELLRTLRARTILLLPLAAVGPFAAYIAFSSWLPSYYNEVFGMPLTQASAIAGLLPLVGIPATLLGGILPARVGLRRPFLIAPGLLFGISALGAILFQSPAVIYPAVILMGFWSWLYVPVLLTVPMEIPGMSPEKVAIAIAVTFTVGDFAGFLSPIAVGVTTDLLGSYLPSFLVLIVLSGSLFLAGLLLPETGPRAAGKRTPVQPVGAGSAP